jgi:hypothetical protein
MSTTLERFEGATLSLAKSALVKERITDAYRNHLALIAEDELPLELREEFRELCGVLTRERPMVRGDDSFRATVRKMSAQDADDVAHRVIKIFASLARTEAIQTVLVPRAKIAKAVQNAAQNVVPLYMSEAAEA